MAKLLILLQVYYHLRLTHYEELCYTTEIACIGS